MCIRDRFGEHDALGAVVTVVEDEHDATGEDVTLVAVVGTRHRDEQSAGQRGHPSIVEHARPERDVAR